MSSTSRRILVTGGAGFIGCNFVRFLLDRRPEWHIVNYDALTYAGNRDNLTDLVDNDRHTFVHADVRDRRRLDRALEGCDAVVHLAAESHVDRSIDDCGPFISTNVLGTQTLLDACRAVSGMERIINVGTDEVYGSLPLDQPQLKFTEDSPLRPNSPYAASKAAADLLSVAYCTTYEMPIIVTRCSNNFGPYQHPEKVIPLFVTNLFDGRKLPLYGDGMNVRDWIHVADHCEALLRILEGGRVGEVYNIGGDNERSNLELTHMILTLLDNGEEMIEWVSDRPGHDRRYAIDSSKTRQEFGWEPAGSAWPAPLPVRFDTFQLMDPDRGLEIHHVVFETRLHNVVVRVSRIPEASPGILGHAVQGQGLDPNRILFAACEDHSPLTGHDVLRDIEAETPEVAECPCLPVLVLGFDCMSAVFDQLQVVPADYLTEGVHRARPAGTVHRQDRPRPRGNPRFHLARVDVHRHRIDVSQNRCAAGVDDGVDRGAERQRRRDDFVARFQPDREHAQVQRGGAGADRHGVRCVRVRREVVLETSDLGPRAQPTALHTGHDLTNLGLIDGRSAEDQEAISDPLRCRRLQC